MKKLIYKFNLKFVTQNKAFFFQKTVLTSELLVLEIEYFFFWEQGLKYIPLKVVIVHMNKIDKTKMLREANKSFSIYTVDVTYG